MKRRNRLGAALVATALIAALMAGCGQDRRGGEEVPQDGRPRQPQTAVAAEAPTSPAAASGDDRAGWLTDEEPPLPTVTVGGQAIAVERGGYSWCVALPDDQAKCAIADVSAPMARHTVDAAAGSRIEIAPPKGAATTGLRLQAASASDVYTVPEASGTYLYILNSAWPAKQGRSEYYFSLRVS